MQKAFTDATAPVTTLANEKETLGGKITTLESQIVTLGNEKTALTSRLTALENEVKPIKTERAALTVDLAIQRGKVMVANRAARITTLENSADFAKDAKTLLEGAPVVKTIGSATAEDRKALANDMDQSGVRTTYLDAFKKHMTDHPDCDPVDAHKAVMGAHPALAEAMRKKETTP
jgi:hypothetical protein